MFNYSKVVMININLFQYWWRMYASSAKTRIKVALKTYGQKKAHYGDLFPDKLLNKKFKTPETFYIANKKISDKIDEYVQPFFNRSPCTFIMECNPGLGLFTRRLLNREEQFKKIILMESMSYFINNLQELHNLYPERVQVKQGDIANIWKLVYQDKIDNGSRVKELLKDIPSKPFNGEPNMVVFGAIGSYQFYKNLIYSLIDEAGLFAYGRPEMYLIIPPPIYLRLTSSKELGYVLYRSVSILFQILFEYRFIARLPREHFLPAQIDIDVKEGTRLKKLRHINSEYLYLVRIMPRCNLHELCPSGDLPALLYFITQNCVSRSNRIIPNLEKFIPGCGPRLLLQKESTHQPIKQLYPDENIDNLPLHGMACTTMSIHDYPDINIYTQFGDLTASQILTVFRQFRDWPEYNESTFLASYENSLLKSETNTEAGSTLDNILEIHDIKANRNDISKHDGKATVQAERIEKRRKVKRKK